MMQRDLSSSIGKTPPQARLPNATEECYKIRYNPILKDYIKKESTIFTLERCGLYYS